MPVTSLPPDCNHQKCNNVFPDIPGGGDSQLTPLLEHHELREMTKRKYTKKIFFKLGKSWTPENMFIKAPEAHAPQFEKHGFARSEVSEASLATSAQSEANQAMEQCANAWL